VKLLSPGVPQRAWKIPETFDKLLDEPTLAPRVDRGPGKSYVRSRKTRGGTSSLRDLALAKEQELLKTKLAYRPKPFWYPYATLRNIAVLERLLAGAGLDLLDLCRGKYGRVADIGAPMEISPFSWRNLDSRWTRWTTITQISTS
jgi:hypothetical protein